MAAPINVISELEQNVAQTFNRGDNTGDSGAVDTDVLSYLHDIAQIEKDIAAGGVGAGTRELMREELLFHKAAVQVLYETKDPDMVRLYGNGVNAVKKLARDLRAWNTKQLAENVFKRGVEGSDLAQRLVAGAERRAFVDRDDA